MGSLWAALFFLSMSWLFTVPVFTPCHWAWVVFIICGIGFSILGLRRMQIDKLDKKYSLFLVPLIISSIFIPFPYNLGPALLALGIAISYLHHKARFTGMGAAISGAILTVESAIVPFYFIFASHYHQASVLAPAANWLLKIFGAQTSLTGDVIFIQTSTNVLAFTVTWEKLGLLPLLGTLLGGIVILLFTSNKKSRIIPFFFLLLAYMLVRYVFLTLMFMDGNRISLYWMPIATSLSFAPLVPILIKLFPLQKVPHLGPLRINKKFWLLGGLTFLCVFCLVGVQGFHDPGSQKQGRILIDEEHSNWEWTTEEYDTRWFGEKSGYNYYSLYSYLNSYYYVDRNFGQLSPTLLSNYDILMVKTPTEPFSPDEVESIEHFVKNGGGLFLISDHTNVFGMSTYINPIAQKFGLHFRYDATYELNSGSLSEYRPPKILPHPIVQYMPPFLFASSCTLEAPLQADNVIIGYGLKSINVDYSQKDFFPTERETPEMDFGLFLQAAAVRHGEGRVVAFTDSTVFSNFWMFMPGKPELALGTIEWLNRQNNSPNPNLIFLLLGLAILFPIGYLTTKLNRSTAILVVLSSALLALPVAAHTYGALNRLNYPPPQPHTGVTSVCFEQEHSDFALPALLEGFNAEPRRQFTTFYVWNQRLGYVPSVKSSLEEAAADGDIVVMINPSKPLTNNEKGFIMDYVTSDGRVLLLDSVTNKDSTANELLEMFDMRLDFTPVGSVAAYYASNKEITTTGEAASVLGGRSLLSTEKGQSILSISRRGQGVVAVMADSHLFSNAQLGGVSSIPDEYQMQISELEFWILQGLMQSQFGDA